MPTPQLNDGSILSLTEHFNGSGWGIVPGPSPGGVGPLISSSFDAVTSPGDGIVWALGAHEKLSCCCLPTLAVQNTTG